MTRFFCKSLIRRLYDIRVVWDRAPLAHMKTIESIFYWTIRLVAAVILLQTLYFKFTAADESVFIFTTVGMEPWGRIGIGILELIAAVLLLVPVTAWMGALLALGLMLGALGMHLTLLGIEVMEDGGYLFALALLVTVCCIYVLSQNSDNLTAFTSALRKKFNWFLSGHSRVQP